MPLIKFEVMETEKDGTLKLHTEHLFGYASIEDIKAAVVGKRVIDVREIPSRVDIVVMEDEMEDETTSITTDELSFIVQCLARAELAINAARSTISACS